MTRKEIARQVEQRHREAIRVTAEELKKTVEKKEKGNAGK
jgi:hypothetical protein